MDINKAEKLVKNKIEPVVYSIAKIFIKNGYKIFLVGGYIRDVLLSRRTPELEYDLATDAKPEEVNKIFKRVIPTGIKHGTVTIIKDDIVFEVTTFRSDGKYSDGRHPDNIEFSDNISDDLLRRDFSINAFAFDLKEQKLIDNFNGLKDLWKEKIVRTIGSADERFQEDGLRLMRAVRFSTVLGFKLEDKTFRSIKKNLFMLDKVAIERIKDEFVKIINSQKPSAGIELLRITEILRKIMPELLVCFAINQNKFHKYDVYYHLLHSLDAAPQNNLPVRLAAFFHDIGKPFTKMIKNEEQEASFYNHEVVSALIAKKILKRLRFSNEVIDRVEKLIKFHMFYYTEEWTDSAVRRFLRKVGLELLDDLFQVREADRIGNGTKYEKSKHLVLLKQRIQKVLDEENAFTVKHLKVSGTDIMKIKKIPPSPKVGEILNFLLEKVIDNPELNNKDILIKMVEDFN